MSKTKLTSQQKADRKHQRAAERMNARAARQYGPLFADMAPVYDATSAYWHNRHNRARGAENTHGHIGPAARGLKLFQLNWIEHHARQYCGAAFDEIKAHGFQVFQDWANYGYGFWRDVLTGKRIVYRYERRSDPTKANQFNPEGHYTIEASVCQLNPAPYTVEQFYEAFPYKEREEYNQPEPESDLILKVLNAYTTN